MSLILFIAVAFFVLLGGYRLGGRFLRRFFQLDDQALTPAHRLRDGIDFEPAVASLLLPQHFSAISAAGPIVGPILAASYFGWFPAFLWIIFGSILVGGVHDCTVLIASVRHGGKSIAELIGRYLNRRAYRLFLVFIWLALIYVIVAFTDVTAGTFLQAAAPGSDAAAPGPGVASSSLAYLLLAVAMGLAVRRWKLAPGRARRIFLPLVIVAIFAGPSFPLDLAGLHLPVRPQLAWDWLLLAYCFAASVAPVWLLLQPRGDLGGNFLYLVMVIAVAGVLIGGASGKLDIQAPAVTDFHFFTSAGKIPPLIPMLFITIACGAISGFHAIVASGTSSKQVNRETDAIPVGYGSMLLEGFFACLALATVMILAKSSGKPDANFAQGLAEFAHHASFGYVPTAAAVQFALLCFATFVFDTLDACTRLARYILMELTGWKGKRGVFLATAVTLLIPLVLVSLPPAELDGKPLPMWLVFWTIFGSTNQLLAALSLLGVTVWLRRLGKPLWLTLAPAALMLGMTVWSLLLMIGQYAGKPGALPQVQLWTVVILLGLALWLAAEVLIFLLGSARRRAAAGA